MLFFIKGCGEDLSHITLDISVSASGTWLLLVFKYSTGLCRKSVAGIISAWLFFAFLFGWFFPPFEFRVHKTDCDISPNVACHTNVNLELQAGVWQ